MVLRLSLSFGILADRAQMPDPEFYRECIDAAWEELNEALLGAKAPRVPAQAPRKASSGSRSARRKPAARAAKPATAPPRRAARKAPAAHKAPAARRAQAARVVKTETLGGSPQAAAAAHATSRSRTVIR